MRLPDDLQGRRLTRRQLMSYFGMTGAGAVLATPAAAWAARAAGLGTVAKAAGTKAAGSDLEAVEHIVFPMMENRSYDHYFGDYPRGRGFDDHPADSLGAFAQSYPGGSASVPPGTLLPCHLDSTAGLACTDGLTRDRCPQRYPAGFSTRLAALAPVVACASLAVADRPSASTRTSLARRP